MEGIRIVSDDILARVMALQADYGHLVDTRNAQAWGALFGESGVLTIGDSELRGRDAIAEFGSTSTAGVHIQAVPHVQFGSDGDLEAVSSFLFVSSATGELTAGTYRDHLVPEGDGYAFARREIKVIARTSNLPGRSE